MHGIRPKVGRRGGAEIGWVGRFLEFAEKPSIANGKKHVALDITKKRMSIILAPTELCHPLLLGSAAKKKKIQQGKIIESIHRPRSKKFESIKETQFSAFVRSNQ